VVVVVGVSLVVVVDSVGADATSLDDDGSASVTVDEHDDIASTETAARPATHSAVRWTVISCFSWIRYPRPVAAQ
jgi:hypothetical protein